MRTILIVEADSATLQGAGWSGFWLEALALAAAHKPAPVFPDLPLPDMSGFELARRLHELPDGPGEVMWPSLKVLFTSGYALETLAARGRLHPGVVVVNKPIARQSSRGACARHSMGRRSLDSR